MKSLRRTLAILSKELRQLRRDRLSFAMIVGIPIMQLALFGYAINTDVRNLDAAVADQANTSVSRELIAALRETQVIDVLDVGHDATEVENRLRRGEIVVGVLIPADFERRLQNGDRPAAELIVDGSDPTVLGVVNQLTAMPFSLDTAAAGDDKAALYSVRPYYNPERRAAMNIVPGLLGVILTMTMVLFTAVAIVRERERGNLEFLINTPIGNLELMIGKIIPYCLIGLLQITLLLILGFYLFDVPTRGSLIDLYAATLLFIGANLALGMLISTLATTQFQAMQMTFFFFLPSILLSGFMFPFDGMPVFAQYLAEILPLTHFVRLARGVMLRDAALTEMPVDVLALAAFFVILLLFAVLRFNKRLD